MSVANLDLNPETLKNCQFLDMLPKTDIMGKNNYNIIAVKRIRKMKFLWVNDIEKKIRLS